MPAEAGTQDTGPRGRGELHGFPPQFSLDLIRAGNDIHPAIFEKSATVSVAARISESSARRLARRCSASATPVTLTVTLSKKASTGARSSESARMAPAKFSTLMAATVSALTLWIASYSAISSGARSSSGEAAPA